MRKRNVLLGLAVALLVCGMATPVFAHAGHAEHDEATAMAAGTDDQKASDRRGSGDEQGDAATFRARGQELLSQLKKERQEHSKEERAKNCQTRKQGLQTKLDNLVKNAQKHKTRIDEVLTKVVAYQTAHNLNVPNYEALLTTATADQATAESSVAALVALKPTVNCNNESVASDVAAFKVAATQARSDLSEYRQAVKAVLKAVQEARDRSER